MENKIDYFNAYHFGKNKNKNITVSSTDNIPYSTEIINNSTFKNKLKELEDVHDN